VTPPKYDLRRSGHIVLARAALRLVPDRYGVSPRGERKVNVDVHAKLAEIRQVVEQARSMPMSASAVVNRSELLQLLDELESGLSDALSDARKVVSDRDAVVAQGRTEAEQIVADAHNERDRLVSDTEVFRVAKRRADEVLEQAKTESEELRKEIDDYVDGKLANFEIILERTMEAVKRGRDRLAGRSALDSLTGDEVDKIKLPEHLEG
jgi:vacuolar-type H+-ATPase subunit H